MTGHVIVIVGPTASGKTELAFQLAKHFDSEIISADSRQVYQYMTIGTAQPTAEILSEVPHHFIHTITPDTQYSAGKFADDARPLIQDLIDSDKHAIVVGGSGLYIKALLDGFTIESSVDQGIRDQLNKRADNEGIKVLYDELEYNDPESAEKIHPNNRQYVIRALELFLIHGVPKSELKHHETNSANFEYTIYGLEWPRPILYDRINHRVDSMIESGLIDEVKQLKTQGFTTELNSLKTVGYSEVFLYLNDQLNYEKMIDLIKQNSRRYAKRQMTWFGKDERIQWLTCGVDTQINELEQMIINDLKQRQLI